MNVTSVGSFNSSLIEQSASNDDAYLVVAVGALAATITALAGTIFLACRQGGGASSSNRKRLFTECKRVMLQDNLAHNRKEIESILVKLKSPEMWENEEFLHNVCLHLNRFEEGLLDFLKYTANVAKDDVKKTANLIEVYKAGGTYGLYTGYYALYYLYRTRAYFDDSGKINFAAEDPDFDARFFTEGTRESRFRTMHNNITNLLEKYGVRNYLSQEAKNWTAADTEPQLLVKRFLEQKDKTFFCI